MKHLLGLLLFCLPFTASAKSNNATLILRAVVPVVYKVDVQMKGANPIVKISSNLPHHRDHGLRVNISEHANLRIVALTQP